ncbi:MAG TPA: undecaprenyldiphospho-muramoylpentapeptide beta-N-acetylglucosaminyltransferase [Candidatus Brocadiia bacterium]|nr:undecaprenyldiphospho-muramoylpentapeptide beta-N-acetylglucosaminyltransferase [Candidatus Brocadiia bacterium]
MTAPTILFCGGGTGGHLTPGLSVAEELRRLLPGAAIFFLGSGREGEQEWVRRHGFDWLRGPSAPWGLHPVRAARFALLTTGGVAASLRLLRRLNPSVVVALGGYAALPPGLAAAITGRPLVLLEQNAIPGKTNRLLSRWAAEVYTPWPGLNAAFKRPQRVHATGNPIRPALRAAPKADAASAFGLDPTRKTLLVMGGSLGAAAINNTVAQALKTLSDCATWLQVLHSTGRATYEETLASYEGVTVPHTVLPFIDDMAAAYAASSFAIARAGGTSIAEMTAAGLPSALIPLPIAANHHQHANARRLQDAGAAILIEQKDFTPQSAAALIRGLGADEPRLAAMSAASRALGAPRAAETIALRILDIIRQRPAAVRRVA